MGLRERLESDYLPRLQSLEAVLRERYQSLHFNTGSSATGELTDYKGHDVFIECTFPDRRGDQSDCVALCISACHLDRSPRLMADVCWGAPDGHIEESLEPAWTANDEWPEANSETLRRLEEAFPRLLEAFKRAVARGQPST